MRVIGIGNIEDFFLNRDKFCGVSCRFADEIRSDNAVNLI